MLAPNSKGHELLNRKFKTEINWESLMKRRNTLFVFIIMYKEIMKAFKEAKNGRVRAKGPWKINSIEGCMHQTERSVYILAPECCLV